MMSFKLSPLALALLIPGAALAQVTLGQSLGTTDDAIRAKLTEAGYAVSEIEHERDEIEVKATQDGKKIEIELSGDGTIKSIELED